MNGTEALHAVKDFSPHVILLDIAMPGTDGLDVCRQLRADSEYAAVKIIALSGFSDAEMRSKTAEAGFDLHLRKPIKMDDVLELLATLRLSIQMTEITS
jgi:CheY-like chemotaxis protein